VYFNGDKLHRIKFSKVNLDTPVDDILDNVRVNAQRHLPQARPYPTNDIRVCLVGGGPSLDDTVDELRDQFDRGHKVVALNNSADWCLDHGIRPSAHVILTARQCSLDWVNWDIPSNNGVKCKYFIASQVIPELFDKLEGRDVYMFHCVNGLGEKEILDDQYLTPYFWVIGGSTVCLRAIGLFRLLGFQFFDLYGIDSCYMGDKHHAYAQPDGEGKETNNVLCAERTFKMSATMVSQADDFMRFVKANGDHFNLNVHGDGVLAHIVSMGAKYYEQGLSSPAE